jgi:peptide/nickel transport system permease protein
MFVYVLKRFAYIGVILVVLSVLIFGITQALPGNVAHVIAGQFAPDEVVEAIEEKLGLHDPLPVQYWRWASGMLVGDLGESLIMERPIAPMLTAALERSAVLALASFIFITIVGIGLGVIAAIRHNRPVDYAVSTFTYLGISVPEYRDR